MDGEKQSNRAHRPVKAVKKGPERGQNPKVSLALARLSRSLSEARPPAAGDHRAGCRVGGGEMAV